MTTLQPNAPPGNGVREAASLLRARGFALCKPDPDTKNPTYRGWSARSLEPHHFAAGDQIALVAGPLSDGDRPGHASVIIDLDSAEAVRLADEHLPPTGMSEGRPGKPRSHRYYLVPLDTIPDWARSTAPQGAKAAQEKAGHPGPFIKSFRHRETGAEVIRFLGTGGQAVCPPSRHPSGELREWDGGAPGEPAVVSFPRLWDGVCCLARASGTRPPSGLRWPWEPRPKCPPAATRTGPRWAECDVTQRAARYLAKCPPAVSGAGGHDRTFAVACALTHGFALDAEAALALMSQHYNPKCEPPWSESDLQHKIDNALTATHNKPRGHLRDAPVPDILQSLRDVKRAGPRPAPATHPPPENSTTPSGGCDATPPPADPPPGGPPEVPNDFGESLFKDRDELARLARLKLDDPAGFAAAQAALRRRKVSVRALDKALSPLVAELRRERQAGTGQPRVPVGSEYVELDGRLCRVRFTPEGDQEATALTNFTARITAHTVRDDGAEPQHFFTVEGRSADGAPLPAANVPTEEFAFMNWPVRNWGNSAIVHAGPRTRDEARAAIQFLSGAVPRREVYAHLGWRQVGSRWVYLHADGAIGPDGAEPDVRVEVTGALAHFVLPDPPEGEALKRAVRASLGLLLGTDRLAPDRVTFPGLCAVYRAPLGGIDFGVHLHGLTGTFKSAFAALLQQHYGSGLDDRHLPASWTSTANALEEQAFLAKDVLVVMDDFNPTGAVDPQKIHAAADRVFRGLGNNAGRGRMTADRTLPAPRPPRGLILSTGEDVMRGHSCRSRVMLVGVRPGDVNATRLTAGQAEASDGLYARAMAGYVRWLAGEYGETRKGLAAERAALRGAFAGAAHARTPTAAADLLLGLRYVTRFALAVGAISPTESRELLDRGTAALRELVADQSEHLRAADPVAQFLRLVPAILTGGLAHLTTASGGAPDPEGVHGWQRVESDGSTSWRPRGNRIGWAVGDTVYLEPEAAFGEVQRLAAAQREPIAMSAQTLWNRLNEQKLLSRVDTRGGRTRFKVRVTLESAQVEVLCFDRRVFFPPPQPWA